MQKSGANYKMCELDIKGIVTYLCISVWLYLTGTSETASMWENNGQDSCCKVDKIVYLKHLELEKLTKYEQKYASC